jgi:hypothetical protein
MTSYDPAKTQLQKEVLIKVKKAKLSLFTGREGPQDYETSRLKRFLDNRLTDGGEVISPTHRPPFSPQEDSWYSFLLDAASIPGPYAAGRVRSIEKSNDIRIRTHDLPACSMMPQPTTLPRAVVITRLNKTTITEQ